MRIVFLDRDSLPVRFHPPTHASTYQEYLMTAGPDVVERLKDADVAIINKVKLTAEHLNQLPSLKMISVTATGYDCVDIETCKRRQIAVTHVRDYAQTSVAEHVLTLLLALRRRLIPHSEASVNGAWPASKQFCHFAGEIVDIAGSTLGLLGYGSLGQAVAERARALGLRVIYFSPSRLHKDPQCVSLTELFETSDALSLHCPLTSDTQHIVNADTLRLMQPSSVVINTARGGLIDELALVHALNTGVIAGAGLDVLSQEPPPADHPLLNCHHPQLIITPHVAWASTKTIEKLADEASLNVDAWIKGERRNRVI